MPYIGVSPSNGVRQKHTYTATASQTTFSGAGSEGISLSYKDSNYVDVYRNGVKLGDADYTATSGTSIVLGEGAAVSDIIEIVTYDVFSVADTVSKADGGTFDGNVAMAGTLAVTGETTLSANLNLGDNDKAIFGAGDDLQIYHNGTDSLIADTGSGTLKIYGDTQVSIQDPVNGEFMANFVKDGAVSLYYNNSVKLATTSAGVDITGELQADSLDIDGVADISGKLTLHANLDMQDGDTILLGNDDDFQIQHNGSNSYIQDLGTGKLHITSDGTGVSIDKGTSENMATFDVDGAVSLFHNNSKKLETTSSGADVSGTQFNLDGGGSNPSLNVKNSDTYYMTLGHDSINVNQNALKLKVNGGTHFEMDSAGHITMGSQPAFLATATGQTNLAVSSTLQIGFASERFDQNADYNTTNSTFTAPVTGKYQLQYGLRLDDLDSASTNYQLRLNTSNKLYVNIFDSNEFSSDLDYRFFTFSVIADMDASDTAIIQLFQNGGSQQTDVDTDSYFSGFLAC